MPITDQINELNDIATAYADTDESISKTFLVSIIVGKLPSPWKDCQKLLSIRKSLLSLDRSLQCI